MNENISTSISELIPYLVSTRRKFHAMPELSFQETATAAAIASELQAMGLEVQTGKGVDANNTVYPWDHPTAHTAPASVPAWLLDTRLFSLVHQGAVLLYNLTLGRTLDNEDNINKFSAKLPAWSASTVNAGSGLQ